MWGGNIKRAPLKAATGKRVNSIDISAPLHMASRIFRILSVTYNISGLYSQSKNGL